MAPAVSVTPSSRTPLPVVGAAVPEPLLTLDTLTLDVARFEKPWASL